MPGQFCTGSVSYLESFILGNVMYWRVLSLESRIPGEFSIFAGEYCSGRYLSLESFALG